MYPFLLLIMSQYMCNFKNYDFCFFVILVLLYKFLFHMNKDFLKICHINKINVYYIAK